MLFNSLEFPLFLIIVFIFFWFGIKKTNRFQNAFLLLASYVFYGWWDWRFLGLILLSSIADFILGLCICTCEDNSRRRLFLSLSFLINLGILGYFKYFNFFVDSFSTMLTSIGFESNPSSLKIILPIGISFYTFQTLSYTIDIYRKDIKAERDPVSFFAFVAFFPQLVAGPIERAKNFLPQFRSTKHFDASLAKDGLRQALWGFFKKMVIADNCAVFVDYIFNNHDTLSGLTLIIGAVFFAFQIYGDFSGYSDIGIGVAKLFGFRLSANFKTPYFSRDIAEFWRRWHVSLSSWFKDYLYIPLGGSRRGRLKSVVNVFIIFLVSGFWHGANWTFVTWGLVHAILFIPLLLFKKNRRYLDDADCNGMLPSIHSFIQMSSTFALVTIAWIFFRADSVSEALGYIANMLVGLREYEAYSFQILFNSTTLMIIVMIVVEWITRHETHPMKMLNNVKRTGLRWSCYLSLTALICLFGRTGQSFIYFQF